MLLVKAGSGIATLGIPGSPGVPEEATRHTLTVPFNDLEAVDKVFAEHGKDLAAVILEPLVGNAGFIRPLPEFLQGLRKRCDGKTTLLIFDEVMTGFRVHPGGVQGLMNIRTDLTTLGKVIGGGLPIGAYGGRKDIMQQIAPQGPIYQAGTLSGNPLACASGIATLEILRKQDFRTLHAKSQRLVHGLVDAAKEAGIALQGDAEGGMFGVFFGKDKVTSFEAAQKTDIPRFNKFFHLMLERGVYLAPSAYEACFMSFAHDDALLEQTIAAAKDAFRVLG
jgi:glutamate-1-semialdehyde 2,1-aminomutase